MLDMFWGSEKAEMWFKLFQVRNASCLSEARFMFQPSTLRGSSIYVGLVNPLYELATPSHPYLVMSTE